MKKAIFLLVLIALFSCEKETCYECDVTSIGPGVISKRETVICDVATKAEAEAEAMLIGISGTDINANCELKK